MAVGALLQSEGDAINGDNYRITIYEDSFAGSVTNFVLAVPMFNLEYQPSTDDIAGNLSPSTVSIYAINENGSLDSFISDFLDYQLSNTYTVLIERDSGSGYYDYWRGILLQDTFESQDRSENSIQVFRAVDGIGALRYVDYDFINSNTTEPESTKVKDMILNCLGAGLTKDLWGASDRYLITSVDWWEDSQTYGALLDPLDTQYSDNRSFAKLIVRNDGYGEIELQTCFDVLQQLARVYLCNVYMAEGAYIFEQIPLRASATVKQVPYDKSGTKLTASIPNLAQTLSQDLDGARLAGNTFEQFPALKRVEVEMAAYGAGFDSLMSISAANYVDTETKEFGFFDQDIGNIIAIGSVAQRILLNVDFKVSADWSYSSGDIISHSSTALKGWIGMRPKCRCKIELNDVASATNYYWNGSSWVTVSTTFDLIGAEVMSYVPTGTSATETYRPSDNVTLNITTDDLPVTGNIDITLDNFRWQYFSALGPPAWSNFSTGDVDLTGESGTVELQLSTVFSRGNTVRLFSIDNSSTEIADNEVLRYPELNLRDGSVGTGCVFIYDGANYVRGINWRIGNGSENIALGALLAKQRLEIQRVVQERYSGIVKTGLGYLYALNFDSKIWRPMNYSFSAYYNEVNATWVAIGVSTEGTSTVGERNPVRENYAPATFGYGKYGGAFRVGGSSIAENLVNNIWYDDDAEVGGTGIAFLMQSGQRNNYTEVDASDTGSSSLSTTDTIAKFTWAGGDGTFSLEIPDADDMDGGLIELILDNTFSGTTDITITPASGNIQGGGSVTINGANSRYVYRAINGNWY